MTTLPIISAEHLAWIARLLSAAAVGRSARNTGELRDACELLARQLRDPRVIRNDADAPYLSRYYLLGGPIAPTPAWDARGDMLHDARWADLPINVYLHHLHCSDDRGRLHSHPWQSAVSLILAGGYREDRRAGDRVVTRTVDPLDLNVLAADDFHRIDLAEADAWSFFVTGQPIGAWHFWDPETQCVTRARPRAWRR